MKRSARCGKILELLRECDEVTVEEACAFFDISPATARRDFVYLVNAGKAEKTWGGVRGLDPQAQRATSILPIMMRRELFVEEKRRIAARAATLCDDGDVVFIDAGTSMLELARWLADRPVRIVTNSLLVAYEIDRLRTGASGAGVYMTGGYVLPQSALLVGPDAIASLEKYRANVAFLSVGGISEEGISNNHPLVVEVERGMLERASKVVLLADKSKFGHRELIAECSWSEFDYLITDSTPAPEFCAAAGERLLIAEHPLAASRSSA